MLDHTAAGSKAKPRSKKNVHLLLEKAVRVRRLPGLSLSDGNMAQFSGGPELDQSSLHALEAASRRAERAVPGKVGVGGCHQSGIVI